MAKPSKKTMSKRKKFATWIWENQIKPIAKSRANNKCEMCGVSGEVKQLHIHHIDGRQNIFMLTLLDNTVCLCATHHTMGNISAHSQSRSGREEFDKWLIEYKGKELIESLAFHRGNSPKLTLSDLEELYEKNL